MSNILIQFEEISFTDTYPVWVRASDVIAITTDAFRSTDSTMIHMRNGAAFLVAGDPIRTIRKLELDYN